MGDTGQQGGAGRRRASMVATGKPDDRGAGRPADGVVDYFKLRVSAQQFMNENGPIFAAFAGASDDAASLLEGGSLAQAVEIAKTLAVTVARRFSGKPEPLPHEVRPFRHAAADIVAHVWRYDGGLKGIDVEGVATEHAAAFHIVDEDLDRSTFAELDLGDEASLAMTGASVTLALMKPVMVYDFRRDRAELVSGMANAVLAMAAEATAQVVPDSAKPDEKRSMLQTTANRLADIMAAVYERKARQVIAHIGALPEEEKETFARRYDPMPEVLRGFRDWGVAFAATSLAFARASAGVVGAPLRSADGPVPRS